VVPDDHHTGTAIVEGGIEPPFTSIWLGPCRWTFHHCRKKEKRGGWSGLEGLTNRLAPSGMIHTGTARGGLHFGHLLARSTIRRGTRFPISPDDCGRGTMFEQAGPATAGLCAKLVAAQTLPGSPNARRLESARQ